MPSSTFNSDRSTATLAIATLLVLVALYFGMLEWASRSVITRVSEGQNRMSVDYHRAKLLRPRNSQGQRTVLVVGNSLLLDGIDRAALQKEIGSDFQVSLFPVEGTTFLDWQFGLRRLFREGSRPDVVILCIGSRHYLSDAVAGEGFAYRLMDIHDLPSITRQAHLDLMSSSSLLFANFSAWLGNREYFRNGLIQRWLPHSDALVARFSTIDRRPLTADPSAIAGIVDRLAGLSKETGAHQASFIALFPPSLNSSDIAPAIQRAAKTHGIRTLIPIAPGTLDSSLFSDGFHLNTAGAANFTAAAGRELRQALDADQPGPR